MDLGRGGLWLHFSSSNNCSEELWWHEREDEDDVSENEEMAAEAINSETDESVLSSRAAVYRPDFNITTASLEMDEVGWGSGKLLSDTSLEWTQVLDICR